MCSIPLQNSQYLEWINEGMLFTSWLEENFVLESLCLSCCETSPGRLCGIRLLLAGHIGLEAFPEAFLEGGRMRFLFYTEIKCQHFMTPRLTLSAERSHQCSGKTVLAFFFLDGVGRATSGKHGRC